MVELIKDYDLPIHYHPMRANVVADALICKSMVSLATDLTYLGHTV